MDDSRIIQIELHVQRERERERERREREGGRERETGRDRERDREREERDRDAWAAHTCTTIFAGLISLPYFKVLCKSESLLGNLGDMVHKVS